MGFTDYEEVQRNQRMKISRAKTPKKSKHKHVYEPCILEYNDSQYTKEHGLTYDKPSARIGAYCPVCGKLGEVEDYDRWFQSERCLHSSALISHFLQIKPTEEYARELDPETRTLPTFWVEDRWFAKFVTLPETQCEVSDE